MTKKLRCLLSLCFCLVFTLASVITVSAAEVAEATEHKLSLTLPEGYVLLNSDTAGDNEELIDSLGYTVSSFKNYLKSGDGTSETLFLGLEPQSKSQISVKSWTTDFSKKIVDLSLLGEDALGKTVKELVQTKGASYKTVSVNGMTLIEMRSNSTDSGGVFCSIQYITIRNGSFYSVNTAFSGSVDDSKVQRAWDMIATLDIKNISGEAVWDVGTILIMILLGAVIIAGVIAAGIIIYSFVRDIKKRRAEGYQSSEYIERRK